MITPLRRTHFWIWIALAAILPVLMVAGLASRRVTTPINPQFQLERTP
jgi:hypothetical protein